MHRRRWLAAIPAVLAVVSAAGLFAAFRGNAGENAATPQIAATESADPIPEESSVEEFAVADFGAVHSPAGMDPNEYLIFGNLPAAPSASESVSRWAVFLGRWEGYGFGPPVKKDWKYVLVVDEIDARGGNAYLWTGTNLQYPSAILRIRFRLATEGDSPAIAWEDSGPGGERYRFAYDPGRRILRGWRRPAGRDEEWGPIELDRGTSFHVYRDYPRYLAQNRIYPKTYRKDLLSRYYGAGYLVYLPEGYETGEPDRTWPLILYLHGSGDRGDNLFLLAKASPLMMIREEGPLPFLVVAPLLGNSPYYYSFPEDYLDGALAEILADYRIDRSRIYATGISIGGEATYRYALHQPGLFAAIAPLSAYLESASGLERIAGLPVRVVHGADDPVIPLGKARQDVEALIQAGADVCFTVLENHDHDVWTDTYRDPGFYAWLLEHRRP